MKILTISHMYPSRINPAYGIFVHEQVKELVRQGCEVKVVAPVPWAPFPMNRMSAKWRAYSNTPKKAEMDGIEIFYPRYICFPRAQLSEYSGYAMYWGIRNIVRQIYKNFKFEIIHAHTGLSDGIAGSLILKSMSARLIITIHGADVFKSIYRNRRCEQALRSVFQKADKVIAVSNKLKGLIVDKLVFLEKVVTIHNGVDSRQITQKAPERKVSNEKKILSASFLIERKGIVFNLMAISNLVRKYPNIAYEIIGDGPEKRKLQKLVISLGLQRNVTFYGNLPHEEVLRHMAKADIFSLPSWDEAFGVVYIEAMAQGKPVIACANEGIGDVVNDGETGVFVRPRDVRSLVKAIDDLLSNPEKASLIGQRARKLVLENYTWTKNAEKTIRLYKEK